jgi:hypothetical protein
MQTPFPPSIEFNYCNQCGNKNIESNDFCSKCGSQIQKKRLVEEITRKNLPLDIKQNIWDRIVLNHFRLSVIVLSLFFLLLVSLVQLPGGDNFFILVLFLFSIYALTKIIIKKIIISIKKIKKIN